jgi:hypothetical protein
VGKYELRYRPGFAEMRIHGRLVEKVTGTARWLTSAEGTPIAVVGIMDTEQPVAWGKSKRSVKPNQRQAWG